MKTKAIAIIITILLAGNACFSQPGNGNPKAPSLEERLKMVDEKICQPLKLDKTQSGKVSAAFSDFFGEMEKLMDKSVNPPAWPEKSKVDALAQKRDEKIKPILSTVQFAKYLELEMAMRPPAPHGPKPEQK